MKFSKLRQLLLVSAIGLVVATILSGCQLVTIDYAFVATSASTVSGSSTTCPNGEIETYAVDSESGAIRIGAPQVCSGGTTPTQRLPSLPATRKSSRRQSGGHEHRPLRSGPPTACSPRRTAYRLPRHPYPWRSVPTATLSMSCPELPRQRCLPTRSRPAL